VQQHDLAALIETHYDYTRPRRNDIRQATVLSVGENEVIVDLGSKRDGIITARDLEHVEDEYIDNLEVGDLVPVSIRHVSDDREGVIVSLSRGLAQQDWLRAQELLESQEPIEATVEDVNRGGVVVSFGRLRGFVPGSHLTSLPRGLRGERREQAKKELVGKHLWLAVLEVLPHRRRLVLSERAARQQRRRQVLEELAVGQELTGTVRSLVDFGAFVDLDGVDGLIHVSELSWEHVRHPSEVLSVGDEVQVYVLSVDREKERVGLSRKRLLPDPWPTVTEGLRPGDVIEGTVSSVVSFGAFVRLGDGVEGLVHVSEMPNGEQTRSGLEPDTPVQVRVLKVDPWRRRIGLSLRVSELPAPLPSERESA
jgi:small subunit ribosomal protein S1